MSPQDKAPAFQWYVRDFMADEAVALMSYEQQGIYRALLDRQWLEGSIPGNVDQIAAILKLPAKRFRKLWPAIAGKFTAAADGRLRNGRLERERQKQDAYRETQRQKGLRSGAVRTKSQPDTNHGSTTVDSRLEPEGNSSSASAVCSLQFSPAGGERTAPARVLRSGFGSGAGAGSNPRDHLRHSWCGDRICVHESLHADFLRRIGGDPADGYKQLTAFYERVHKNLPSGGFGDDIFEFWRAAYSAEFPSAAPKVNARAAAMQEPF